MAFAKPETARTVLVVRRTATVNRMENRACDIAVGMGTARIPQHAAILVAGLTARTCPLVRWTIAAATRPVTAWRQSPTVLSTVTTAAPEVVNWVSLETVVRQTPSAARITAEANPPTRSASSSGPWLDMLAGLLPRWVPDPGVRFAPPMGYDPAPLRGSRLPTSSSWP